MYMYMYVLLLHAVTSEPIWLILGTEIDYIPEKLVVPEGFQKTE